MPNLSSSSVPREVPLRKQLLNKIFLQTLNHDDDPLDDTSPPETSSQAPCLPIPTYPIREQAGVSEITEQDIEMKNEEILMESSGSIFSEPTDKQMVSEDNKSCLKSQMECNDSHLASATNSASLQDFSSLMVEMNNIDSTTEAASSEAPETSVLVVQKTPRSSKRMAKKYSKILARIESLERSVATFCEKENELPTDAAAAFKNHNSISVFQNITSSQQKKKYEKYFKKTLKVCNRLEGEISLYSQYVSTLETAVGSIPKGSKLSKMLEAKLKNAYKFHEEKLSHEELKTLMRQLKLVNLLINKFESKKEQYFFQ